MNIILTILTLGIYSAWAKVRHKKYIYGSARLNGAGFEYLADPAKILKGRMIVVVFLVITLVVCKLRNHKKHKFIQGHEFNNLLYDGKYIVDNEN